MEKKYIEREVFCGGLKLREASDGGDSRVITGRAILFGRESAPLWEDTEEVAVEVISPDALSREFLDGCDIKMTMFHDRQLLLARSNRGEGTLKYTVGSEGVDFEFDAPHTADGDKALELVKRGDLAGCSFAFRTNYWDEAFVSREVQKLENGKTKVIYTVRQITDVRDFTLAADPAYPDTECSVREIHDQMVVERMKKEKENREREKREKALRKREAVRSLRKKAE